MWYNKIMTTVPNSSTESIILSPYTLALLNTISSIKKESKPHDASFITVSQTVSFFAILYEKVRNAVEFREEHLIRRAAIERILKRRLVLNPDGRGEGENLTRELLWARYLAPHSITQNEITLIQTIIDQYVFLKKRIVNGRPYNERVLFLRALMDFLTCEIEEELHREETQKKSAYLYFFYQVLKNKITIKEVPDGIKDTFFYVASENGFARSDIAYTRYHLFRLSHQSLIGSTSSQLDDLISHFPHIIHHIEKTVHNEFHLKLSQFTRKQVAPFRILFAVIDRNPSDLNNILMNKKELWKKVDSICREKYRETSKKLQRAAVRSVIYIFLTKMLFILLLEYPLSLYFYKEALIAPIIVNALFPPILMTMVVSIVTVPSEKNTRNIYNRIIDILNKDPSFEITKTLLTHRTSTKRPLLIFGFTVFYLFTFGVTFTLIYYALDFFKFTLVSKGIFIFFLTVVTFFAYRIRQTAREYTLEDKGSILSPVIDFFFMPIVSVGKLLSQGVAKVNIFILIFDVLIEAPFKLIFEIVEEWINFVRAKKDEIM